MGTMDDPFGALTPAGEVALFEELAQRPVGSAAPAAAVFTARLHGFALDDSPLLGDLPQMPGELVSARSAVTLKREQIGASVVVVLDGGEARRPIVLGVLQDTLPRRSEAPAGAVTVFADDERYEIQAEREIVLRCGDASITLTRAGKVLIKGNYVISRSTGYNKIKGAAVDIN